LCGALALLLNFAIVNCGQARLARLQFTIAQVGLHNPTELAELANYAQAPIVAPTCRKQNF